MCAVDLAGIRDVARQLSQGSKARPRNCQGLGHGWAKGWAGWNGVTLRMPTSASDADISESIGVGHLWGVSAVRAARSHLRTTTRSRGQANVGRHRRLHRSWPILAKAAEAVLVYHVAIGSDRVKNKIRPTQN